MKIPKIGGSKIFFILFIKDEGKQNMQEISLETKLFLINKEQMDGVLLELEVCKNSLVKDE